ncbi:MAG: AmmeMemoRadiSam system radical SAM enzyme [Fidelibacterota bacterium]
MLAKWWQAQEDNRVQCQLCPRNCIIAEDKKGFCQTRQNKKGKLHTLVYGYPSALNIDPIEKKPLFHFYPGSRVFSIGTIGCNLECQFCQNYQIARQNYVRKDREYLAPAEVVDLAVNNECESIAFTYNEPTVFGEYIIDIAEIARAQDLKTVIVSNGYINPEPLREIYSLIDAANIDLKSSSGNFYSDICHAEMEPVLRTIQELAKMDVFLEITNLIVSGYNDSENNVTDLLDWLYDHVGPEVPLHFSAFHPAYKMLNVPRTSKQALDNIRQIALDKGFLYVYEGNVMTTKYDNTYCPNCGELLIERQIFTVVKNNLKQPRCKCGQKINIKL